jgi:OmcA/MtrC family decaheme c-type cytochrome
MMLIRRTLAIAVTAGVVSLTGAGKVPKVVEPRIAIPPQQLYPTSAREHYLATEQADFARPGYHIQINSVTIGADRKPVVDITLTDDLGAPLDRKGIETPGVCTVSFIVAWYNAATRDYTSYTTRTQTSPITHVSAVQAAADSGGVIKDLETGHFTYTFGKVLPADFDQTKTHTVGAYGRRTMPADIMDGKVYIDNVEFDFRPDAQAVTEKWDEIQERFACNQCHNPLQAHGEVRQDAKLCVLCHSPQTSDPDTGNTVDMRVMIHKIHRGPNLPSVQAGTPYVIIGNQQSVHDFSHTTYPQDIRNCQNCHEGRNPAQRPSQSDVWYTKPARQPCGACHDNVNWVTGENHAGGPQADDGACASCHVPESGTEYDASIRGAHTPPYRSKQLKGLNATIIAVDNAGPDKKPVVTFRLTENDGTVLDPGTFGSNLNILLGGPTIDYGAGQNPPAQPFRERADGATFNGDTAVYTFNNAIPANATGSWAVAIEARRTITLNPAPRKGPATYTEGAVNPVKYIAVTDGQPVPRRLVVTLDKCNACHDRLATTFSHGGQRIAIEECDICHNSNADDRNRRPADKNPPESIAFKRMIHRIHTGEQLAQEYTVYGFGGNPTNFNEVRYPGDRRDCLQCHASASTYDLPLPLGTLPVITQRDFFSPQGPGTAACLGCHSNVDAAAHAFLNTATFPGATTPAEACATCHGAGNDWAVDKVHAR